MIYSKDGSAIWSAYDKNGQEIDAAYNVSGSKVFANALKVMTYNVGGWYIGSGRNVPAADKSKFYALQTGMIEANDPDVLVIQEYLANFSDDGTSALTMLQGLFPYVHAKTSGTYFGRAICSKYPITGYTERTYTQENSRYYDSCTITVNGTAITFVNTHLGLTQENRTAEITELISYLSTLTRFVACGDYNTTINENDLTTRSEAYIENVKPFIDAGFHTVNYGVSGFLMTHINPSTEIEYYIDNEYTSSNIEVLEAYVDDTKLDELPVTQIDHMPLIALLQIGGS